MVKKYERGQILLIVILSMIVALTVGLSIAARIVTELKLSKQNEESQRAFQAAESGIQQTLSRKASVGSINVPVALDNNSAFSTTFDEDNGNGTVIVMNNGLDVDQAIGGDVWLSEYSTNHNNLFDNPMGFVAPNTYNSLGITMYWGSTNQTQCTTSSGESTAPAIEVVLLKGPKSNPSMEKNVYEAGSCTRIDGATASNTSNSGVVPLANGPRFRYSQTLLFNNQSISHGLVMKVIPIYNSTIVGFQSTSPAAPNTYLFPAQGAVITSTGSSGDTVRRVRYYQSYPQIPVEIFPYSQLSQ